MTDVARFETLAPLVHGLSVVVTGHAEPHLGHDGRGWGASPSRDRWPHGRARRRGGTRMLAHLRADPTITVVVPRWLAVGRGRRHAQLMGPDDPDPEMDHERIPLLRRETFSAAGRSQDDRATCDRVVREARPTGVVVAATRVCSNPEGAA